MVTPTLSRFALLTLDDEGDSQQQITNIIKKKKNVSTELNINLKPDQKKKRKTDGTSKSIASHRQNQNGKAKNKGSKGVEKKKKFMDKQWEQWKEKDAQIMQSEVRDIRQQDLIQSELMNARTEPDTQFFKRVKSDAKEVLRQEQAAAPLKAREPFFNDIITISQYKEKLEQSNQLNATLTEEVKKLKDDLQKIKKKNIKLCELLFKGETQDMGKLLVTVDNLQKVKDELSLEVSNLHVLLEQERSKTRATDIRKNKK